MNSPLFSESNAKKNNFRSLSINNIKKNFSDVRDGKNIIQRTVSIKIEGEEKNMKNEEELMNTLSRLILGEDSHQDG
jgi:hypothetical protein